MNAGSSNAPLATVVALNVAPVKALACRSVPEIHLGPDGVAEDRRMWLVTQEGRVVTQRQYPALVQVASALDLATEELRLEMPDGSSVTDGFGRRGDRVHSRLFGKDRVGRIVAPDAAVALSEVAGEPLRLVVSDEPGVGWDEGPVSLLATSSAEAVGAPPDARGRRTLRFRMLVEVDGPPAYAEEGWVGQVLTLGGARIWVDHALGRCKVIRHSPLDASRDWNGLKEIVRIRGRDRLDLGVIATVEQPGRVAVGDQVTPG